MLDKNNDSNEYLSSENSEQMKSPKRTRNIKIHAVEFKMENEAFNKDG